MKDEYLRFMFRTCVVFRECRANSRSEAGRRYLNVFRFTNAVVPHEI